MKRTLLAVCSISILLVPALAQNASPPIDQKFLEFAAQTDMVEANLGDLAQTAASSQAVKDFGHMVASDHTQDYQKLEGLAQQAGLKLPTAIDAAHNKSLIGPLHALKGAAFDHTYIRDMVAGHTQAIAMFKKEAETALNPTLKAYAKETLPTLQKHFEAAKAIQQGKTPVM